MRLLAGVAIGTTLAILWNTIGSSTLAWALTRIEPGTHPDCKPRYRTWHDGIMTEGPW